MSMLGSRQHKQEKREMEKRVKRLWEMAVWRVREMQRKSCRKTSCHFSKSWMPLTDSIDPHANRQCSYCSLKESVIKQANMEINPQNFVLFFFNVRFLGYSKTIMSGPLPPCYCCPQWLSICLRCTQGRNCIHHYWLLLVLKGFVMERPMSA